MMYHEFMCNVKLSEVNYLTYYRLERSHRFRRCATAKGGMGAG